MHGYEVRAYAPSDFTCRRYPIFDIPDLRDDDNDEMDGGLGNDQLFGDEGSDTLRGGSGATCWMAVWGTTSSRVRGQ